MPKRVWAKSRRCLKGERRRKRSGCAVKVTKDPKEAVREKADIIYTDVWASMERKRSVEKG